MKAVYYAVAEDGNAMFTAWLRCYNKAKSVLDSGGRTIWYHGELGPLAPKSAKPGRDMSHKAGKSKRKPTAQTETGKKRRRTSGSVDEAEPEAPKSAGKAKNKPKREEPKAVKSARKTKNKPNREAVLAVNARRTRSASSTKK
eukprot:TRINITY_DN19775_c0_g1_i1.p2 TRINITY_DN19775_c0_g1~~TRINITY_DN19775_c0_g1_i1.p2  ORF type:complete len:143 (-),score=21.94 TRINITY_DN19775_c0_g1_i1:154-582(-)